MYALKAEFEYLDRLFNLVLKNTKNFIHSFCLKLRVKPQKKLLVMPTCIQNLNHARQVLRNSTR